MPKNFTSTIEYNGYKIRVQRPTSYNPFVEWEEEEDDGCYSSKDVCPDSCSATLLIEYMPSRQEERQKESE